MQGPCSPVEIRQVYHIYQVVTIVFRWVDYMEG